MKILLTGGLGFIGSHICVELLGQGYDVTIIDDLSNSNISVIDNIFEITQKRPKIIIEDIRNKKEILKVFNKNNFNAVIHLAGLKSVADSNLYPLDYFEVNTSGTLNILQAIKNNNITKLIFSSSATVYGAPCNGKITESHATGKTLNPYATSKHLAEKMIIEFTKTQSNLNSYILRYFNPIGAHPSGKLRENPKGKPNNLMPYILSVINGDYPVLNIFGNTYNTKDGTGVRDYIHVQDLAKAHLAPLSRKNTNKKLSIYNVGTGIGYSVLDIVNLFENTFHFKIPTKIRPPRDGDVPTYMADPQKITKELGWIPKFNVEMAIKHSLNSTPKV